MTMSYLPKASPSLPLPCYPSSYDHATVTTADSFSPPSATEPPPPHAAETLPHDEHVDEYEYEP